MVQHCHQVCRCRKAQNKCKKCRGLFCFHKKLQGKEPYLVNPLTTKNEKCLDLLDKLVADEESSPEQILKEARYGLQGKEPNLVNPLITKTEKCLDLLDKLVADEESSPEQIIKEARYGISVDPLCFAAATNHIEGARKLLKSGADPNKSVHGGQSALILATRHRNYEVAELLLKHGANVRSRDIEGFNSLMLAILTGDAKLVNLLWLNRGNVDINQQNHAGFTALHLAADKSWETCVSFLLTNGASPDIRTKKSGLTPLMIAALKGDIASAEKLIVNNADILLEDEDGFTAVCLAQDKGRTEMIMFLMSKLSAQEKGDAFVKSRIDYLRKPEKDTNVEVMISDLYIDLFQTLSKAETYRDILLRQKLIPSLLILGQRYMRSVEVVVGISSLVCACLHRTEDQMDDRFCQQFLRSKGPDFCLKVAKMFSEETRRETELLIASLFPIACLALSKDGKEWVQKNRAKVAMYAYLSNEYDSMKYPDENLKYKAGLVWKTFWEDFIHVEYADRDQNMLDLLEEEERERTKKAKKREKKRQKRLRAQQLRATAVCTTSRDVDEQVRSKLETSAKSEMDRREEKHIDNSSNVSEEKVDHCPENEKTEKTDETKNNSANWTKVKCKRAATKQVPKHSKPQAWNNKNKKDKAALCRVDKTETGLEMQWSDLVRSGEQKARKHPTKELVGICPDEKISNISLDYEEEFPSLTNSATTAPKVMGSSSRSSHPHDSRSSISEISNVEFDTLASTSIETCEEERPHWLESDTEINNVKGTESDYWRKTRDFEENLRYSVETETFLQETTYDDNMLVQNVGKSIVHNPNNSPEAAKKADDHFLNMEFHGDYDKTNNMPDKDTTMLGSGRFPSCQSDKNNGRRRHESKITLKDVAVSLYTKQKSNLIQEPRCPDSLKLKCRRVINASLSAIKHRDNEDKRAEDETETYSFKKGKEDLNLNDLCAPLTTGRVSVVERPNIIDLKGGLTVDQVEAKLFQASMTETIEKQDVTISTAAQNKTSQKIAIIEPIGHITQLPQGQPLSNTKDVTYHNNGDGQITSQISHTEGILSQTSGRMTDNSSWSVGIREAIMAASNKRQSLNKNSVTSSMKDDRKVIHSPKTLSELLSLSSSISDSQKPLPGMTKPDKVGSQLQENGETKLPDRNCCLGETILTNAMNIHHGDCSVSFLPSFDTYTQTNKGLDPPKIYSFPSLHDENEREAERKKQEAAMVTIQELQKRYLQAAKECGVFGNCGGFSDYQYYACCAGVDTKTETFSETNKQVPNPSNSSMVDRPMAWNIQGSSDNRKLRPSGYSDDVVRTNSDSTNRETIPRSTTSPEVTSRVTDFVPNQPLQTIPEKNLVRNDNMDLPFPTQSANKMALDKTTEDIRKVNTNSAEPAMPQRVWTPRSRRWRGLLTELFNLPPRERHQVGDIVIPLEKEKFRISYSDLGAFLGFLTDGTEVAVVEISAALVTREFLENLFSSRFDVYFLAKYKSFAIDGEVCWLAMELHEYTIAEVVLQTSPMDYGQHLTKWAWQIMKGLSALHESCGIIHGNLMPSNVLVDVEGRIKLSEFGFSTARSTDGGLIGKSSLEANRKCWTPTEVTTETDSYSAKSDIQVAGMLLYYLLTKGGHPYGENSIEITVCIQQNWYQVHTENAEVNNLITSLLIMPPSARPDVNATLKHPYFWANEKKLRLVLIAGSDVLRDMKLGVATNSDGGRTMIDILNTVDDLKVSNWTNDVDVVVMKEMRSFRQYKNTLVELVLFVYNCCLHYEKLSEGARDVIDEPCRYFLNKFPGLCISVYTAIKRTERVNKLCYRPFF